MNALNNLKKWEYLHIVWQFNSEFGACNYRCPYCYYASGTLRRQIKQDVRIWREAFKRNFDEKIVLYLSFGEPTIGISFMDIVEMVSKERKWILHITTNLSRSYQWWEKLLKREIVKEGRFFVNASFHPTEASIDKFVKKLLLLREYGIEAPVIIVMWPPILKRFEKYFKIFDRYGFLVHVRRFQGWYNGKWYPRAYTIEERKFIAKYADDGTIKFMLNDLGFRGHKGKLSYAGMSYILVDELGNVWESPDSRGKCLGNIFKGNVKLFDKPQPYSGRTCASVQGVSALLEAGYQELKPNFVLSFARQGGVYHTRNGVYYKNMNMDFEDPKIRKYYNFPKWYHQALIWIFTNILDKVYYKLYFNREKSILSDFICELLSPFYTPPTRLLPYNRYPSSSHMHIINKFINAFYKSVYKKLL